MQIDTTYEDRQRIEERIAKREHRKVDPGRWCTTPLEWARYAREVTARCVAEKSRNEVNRLICKHSGGEINIEDIGTELEHTENGMNDILSAVQKELDKFNMVISMHKDVRYDVILIKKR